MPPKGKKKVEELFSVIQGPGRMAVGPGKKKKKKQYTGQRVLGVHPATLEVVALAAPTLFGLQQLFR